MSLSIQSETSKDEIETEDAELEDLVWNLMSRTGLLSQIQGQISKFIEDNGKTENVTKSIYPERADGRILGLIFEYLQWVGMKQTNSVLLSESPIEVDLCTYESRVEGPDYRPEICKILEEHTTEGKVSPTRSHNYSRDEFEDSRLTSASGHQSIKSDNVVEDEASPEENDSEEEESYSSHKQAKHKIAVKAAELDNDEKSKEASETANVASNNKLETDMVGVDGSADMISFSSPAIATRGFDQIRPHVTLRQKFDSNMSDPFRSPTAVTRMPLDSVPTVDSNNRLNFVQASNSLEEILIGGRMPAEESPLSMDNVEAGYLGSMNKELSLEKSSPRENVPHEDSAKESRKSEQKVEVKEPPSASQDEEESTSDLMDMLTMEEDTQDASIDSDAKGMSSCEHAVSLK